MESKKTAFGEKDGQSLLKRAKVKGSAYKSLIAGALVGGIKIYVTYPAEYIKTQLQLDVDGHSKKYDGIVDCLKKTVKKRGYLGLYHGITVTRSSQIPRYAIRFSCYEVVSDLLRDEQGDLGHRHILFSGLCAGIVEAILVITPNETVKVNIIYDQRRKKPKYRNTIHGVYQILRKYGFFGLYKGLLATTVKEGSNQAIRFHVVYVLKNWYTENDPLQKTPTLLVGLFGAVAGAVSVFSNNPFDVVKTRLQGREKMYKNTRQCFFKIYREEGLTALYKGTIPRLWQICLQVGTTFMLYDTLIEFINTVFDMESMV